MGTRITKNKKVINGVLGLDYVEIKNVPFTHDPEFGDAIHSKVLGEIENYVAKRLLLDLYHLRGLEVEFFRNIFAMSKRELGAKLSLSHVSIVKWEKTKKKPLDLVNDIALRVLMLGLLKIKVHATIENLAPTTDIPKKLVFDYEEITEEKNSKRAA